MKKVMIRLGLLVLFLVVASTVWGAGPYIGYVYPAGGQKGTVFTVSIGGQRLGGVRDVIISGKGVRASIVGYEGASGPLKPAQQDELKRQLLLLQSQRTKRGSIAKQSLKGKDKPAKLDVNTPIATLPNIPELQNLSSLTNKQLIQIRSKYLDKSKRTKPPLAETVTLEFTIDADASPGDRELRLISQAGLTNPIIFQVGQLAEIYEDSDAEQQTPVKPSVVFNGQIMPGETDSFPLQLKQGQQLVMAAQARYLIPYLADAVPGWFQAFLSLSDSNGKELASADHCGFDQDPVIFFKVPKDGTYTLKLHDTLYRGRKDFVYRLIVAEENLCKSLFPSGNRGGIQIAGTGSDIFSKSYQSVSIDNKLAEIKEIEPNDKGQKSQLVALSCVVQGCIKRPGDVDVFKISGNAGDEVVLDAYARRIGSHMDSLIRLIGSSGKVIAFNDDYKDASMGLLTHHSDSYISAKLPATGTYFVQISDSQHKGGDNFGYYLRISSKQPDFALRISPSSINIPAGSTALVTFYAFRRDGWNGDIDIALKNAPTGFTLSGARIPAGRDSVRMTLAGPSLRSKQPVSLSFEGSASIGGKTVSRPVLSVENLMQAFAYQHLVPSQQLLAIVIASQNAINISRNSSGPLQIPSGGQIELSFTVKPMPNIPIQLELNNPPPGITLQDTKSTPEGIICTIKADSTHAGYTDNLIIEAFTDVSKNTKGKTSAKKRVSLGVLPAVSFEIGKQ
jgi:hypothetical protein